MRFQLTDDQLALRAGVRELLVRCFGREALRAAVDAPGRLDRALWRTLGEAVFFALRLPVADGGVGLGLPEAVLAFEEAGRALLPGPAPCPARRAGRRSWRPPTGNWWSGWTRRTSSAGTCPARWRYGRWIR